MPAQTDAMERTYHILGVPLRAGSLYPGSENDAQAYRDAGLLARLQAAGCNAVDDGDVEIPSYLPHHSIPPIRNWPGPRIAWDCVSERILPYLRQPGHVPLLIGADCSTVVGATQALARVSHHRGTGAEPRSEGVGEGEPTLTQSPRRGGEVPDGFPNSKDVHVLYVDGDLDHAPPTAERCQSAAAVAVWLLTHASPFWAGPALRPSQVTVIGWNGASPAEQDGVRSLSLTEVRRLGPAEAARQALETIPPSAAVLLHVDIDVFQQQAMPAAYFPHADGLDLAEGTDLLTVLAGDPRIRAIELTEYASLRDPDQRHVSTLVNMLAEVLGPHREHRRARFIAPGGKRQMSFPTR